jgi:hypothetical protein
MRKIGCMVFVGAAVALGAVTTSPALAVSLCLPVDVSATGTYEEAKCEKEQAKGSYVLAVLAKRISAEVWCAKLDNGSSRGYYETAECKTETPEKGAYDLVKLTRAEAEEQERSEGVELPSFAVIPTLKKFTGAGGATEGSYLGDRIKCAKSSSVGEITGKSTVGKVTLRFTGCKIRDKENEAECELKTAGAATEEIVTRTLKGTLGTVKASEAPSEIGLLLEPEATKKFMTIAGGACIIEAVVLGSIAGEITPLRGGAVSSDKLVFAEHAERQEIRKIAAAGKVVEPILETLVGVIAAGNTVEQKFESSVEVV